MPRYRRDINNDKEAAIKKDMYRGKSIENTALKHDVSYTLARQIKYGTRVKPPTQPEQEEPVPEGQLCTHCNTRPKAPGNKYLCTLCFGNN